MGGELGGDEICFLVPELAKCRNSNKRIDCLDRDILNSQTLSPKASTLNGLPRFDSMPKCSYSSGAWESVQNVQHPCDPALLHLVAWQKVVSSAVRIIMYHRGNGDGKSEP